jgi:uncharacterized protein
MKTLTAEDFKSMPWKNGGGITVELFRIPDPQVPDSFLFRLSRAHVKQDGPFSKFHGIDRILVLLKGQGIRLNSIPLRSVLNFRGEEDIHCELINGEVIDFNVMTKRTFATATLTRGEGEISGPAFVYSPEKHELKILEEQENCSTTSQELVVRLHVK